MTHEGPHNEGQGRVVTIQDIAHLDALWAQASLHDDDEHSYLAGIGALWPVIRADIWWAVVDRGEKKHERNRKP